jgi:hypothetical protein
MPWILPESSTLPETYEPPSTTSLPPTLLNVLDSITFVISQTKSFFGTLDKHDALARIKEQASLAARDDVLKEIEIVQQRWNGVGAEDLSSSQTTDILKTPIPLNPVRKVSHDHRL